MVLLWKSEVRSAVKGRGCDNLGCSGDLDVGLRDQV